MIMMVILIDIVIDRVIVAVRVRVSKELGSG